MAKYNINELLEKKKALEEQIQEKKRINPVDLTYEEQKTIDYTNEKNNRTFVPRERINLVEYTTELSNLTKELAKIKTAIQEHNTEKLSGKLQEREDLRVRFEFLKSLKKSLSLIKRGKDVQRETLRQGEDGETLEVRETETSPMFDIKAVEKMMNEVANQERKVNTEIQKINLSAQIEL